MKDMSATDPRIDDIGTLIDEALADPSRAEIVKARIRERLAGRSAQAPAPLAHEPAEGDAEDLWDNLPL
jgi:hypothetical protein